ncbi:MAG: aconitate hydratase [Deltaproteobacteria bacterium]|jgi:aconitate hydratase|nr:aconitate hydratase [Deltaproteobacteria bacterium]
MPLTPSKPLTITEKIIKAHLVRGEMVPGEEIGIRMDQTLVHDATGQMAMLQFEALGIERAVTGRSLIYSDHNILQVTHNNADDHAFLRTAANKFGLVYSKVGNGICHQLNLERFSVPGETLLGADSHTTTGGAVGELAIGAGGLDVAAAMGGAPFWFRMPKVMRILIAGALRPWVAAKDAALKILETLTVSGGRGRVLEFRGPGIATLSVTERATISNMSIETGALTSVFPSDAETLKFLKSQGREKDYKPLDADPGASYDSTIELDLSRLEPLAACPHSPDNVKKVSELRGIKCDQVAIGSCTNSSHKDLMTVARILKGKKIPASVSLIIAPGSRQVLSELAAAGALSDMISAGARIMEVACGFCNGVGQAPKTDGVSLRTSNRNFPGRSGTPTANLYLVSPETAALSALAGEIVSPDLSAEPIVIETPEKFAVDDGLFVHPPPPGAKVEIERGPSIAPLPRFGPIPDRVEGPVMLSLGDNVTTDDILPAGAHILALRANVPAISKYIFHNIDPKFPERQLLAKSGFVVAGDNYGQGSSREHAALAPRYLGLTGIIAKSFARIHQANLCNFGLLPLIFVDPADKDAILPDHVLVIDKLREQLVPGGVLTVLDATLGREFKVRADASARQTEMLLAGGLLALAASKAK